MEGNDNIKIVGRHMIKPSSPTPLCQKTYNLSFFNQSSSRMYIPIVLFYHKSPAVTHTHQYSSCLKKSLAETLNLFYPFAGRIIESELKECDDGESVKYVDCNDEGVIFLEAKLGYTLSKTLENPRAEILDHLFPYNLQWSETSGGALLAVQVTYFDCGGFAMSVCLSHKVADLATTLNFLQYWAAISISGTDHQLSPPDLFKAEHLFPASPMTDCGPDEDKCIMRRFVFQASKISALKNSIAGEVKNPSRVEVVTALLYKCAISASNAGKSTILLQTVNLRKRIEPPLADNIVGSLIWFFRIPTDDVHGDNNKLELSELVAQMKHSLKNFQNNIAKELMGENLLKVIHDDENELECLCNTYDSELYRSSSWCKFPIYELDFGWGNPVWASVPSNLDNNVMILMDTKTGGIEAYVSLHEEEMAVFELDQELLRFAEKP